MRNIQECEFKYERSLENKISLSVSLSLFPRRPCWYLSGEKLSSICVANVAGEVSVLIRGSDGDNWSAGKIALSKFAGELGEQTAYCDAKNHGELISRNLLDLSHALPSNRRKFNYATHVSAGKLPHRIL